MIIAGTSEFLLLASLLFAALKGPKLNPALRVVYLAAIASTFLAATMGVFRYLELADTVSWHTGFSFASKHLGMAIFIGLGLFSIAQSGQQKKPIYALLALSSASLLINLFTELAILSDATIVLLLAYGIYLLKGSSSHAIQLSLATTILLSTLVWGAIIQNPDIRLGIFHLCLSTFIFLFAQVISRNSKEDKPQAEFA